MILKVETYSKHDPSVIDCRFMNMLQFNKRKSKSFVTWRAILITPGAVVLVSTILTLPVSV